MFPPRSDLRARETLLPRFVPRALVCGAVALVEYLVLLLGVTVLLISPVAAQTVAVPGTQVNLQASQPAISGIATLPRAPQPAKRGVGIDLGIVWPDAEYGYVPIRVGARAIRNSARDRRVEVTFRASRWRGDEIEVRGSFILPANTATAEIKLLVPKYVEWNWASWDIWIDGRYADELSAERQGIPMFQVANSLAISKVVVLLGTNETVPKMAGTVHQQRVLFTTLNTNELPRQWLAYSSRDAVVLSTTLLNQLPTSHPREWQALRRWVAVGGNLVVLQLNTDPPPLEAVAQTLQMTKPDDLSPWQELDIDQEFRTIS